MAEVIKYVLPGLSMFGLFFVAHILMLDISAERDQKTLRRILAGPVTVGQFLAAKVIVAFLVCVLADLFLIIISVVFFGMTWGNPISFAATSFVIILAIVGMMAFVHGVAKTRNQADNLSNLVIIWMCMFGGTFFPLEEMPAFMREIGRWTINYWSIDAMKTIINGGSLGSVLGIVGGLSICGILTLSIGVLAMRRQLVKG